MSAMMPTVMLNGPSARGCSFQAHVFAIVGDGGFLMNGAQELLTAIENDLHITILVV